MHSLKNHFSIFRKEIITNKVVYAVLLLIFIGGLFIRTYRTDQILNFYYDEGRDAIEIWELWHEGDLFLIGPTTGIAGIFRGPFYYYLIAPFYLLGQGDPVYPAYFLAFLSMIAVIISFFVLRKIQSSWAGIFAAILGSFSYYIMYASRWLSNPTPMLLLSVVLVALMIYIAYTPPKKLPSAWWAWVLISFVSGLSLFHFGSSGEFFYFPALIIFALWQTKRYTNKLSKVRQMWSIKTLLLSLGVFLFTASPLILFDFLKDNILSNNIRAFLLEEESFKATFWEVVKIRFPFYYGELAGKIFHDLKTPQNVLMAIIGIWGIIRLPILLKNPGFKVVFLMMLSPIIGLLFFQGNEGNVYGYYLTGYYLIFIMLVSLILGDMWKFMPMKIFVIYFFYSFIAMSFVVNRYYVIQGVDGEHTIKFGNEKQAVEWVYNDSNGRPFNIDVYVPPVIPHAYNYLFMWYGSKKYSNAPIDERIELLYTIAEVDPPHPERRTLWDVRQQGIGSVEEEVHFGGITVQRRKRFMDKVDEY